MLASCSTSEKLYPFTEIRGKLQFRRHITQSGAPITMRWGVRESQRESERVRGRIMVQEPQALASLTEI